jgi:hypothetical protein
LTLSGMSSLRSIKQGSQPFGDPFGNERMTLRVGMYLIDGEVVIAEDIVHEIGDKQCPVSFADLFVAGQILVAKNPYSQFKHGDHRAVICYALDDAVKVVKCLLPIDFLAKIVSAEFHDDQEWIVREHVPIEPGKRILRRIAVDSGIEHLYVQLFSDKRWKSLVAIDAVAGADTVTEAHNDAPLRIEV